MRRVLLSYLWIGAMIHGRMGMSAPTAKATHLFHGM
jgi:hypothetical protein